MTTHILKTPCPLSAVRTHCGLALTGDGPKPAPHDFVVGQEDGLCRADCVECLRGLVVAIRLAAAGDPDQPEHRWWHGGDTGISARTIWAVMMGRDYPDAERPHSGGAFARCERLLEQFPEWRPRLPEVAARHPAWAGLVSAWDELATLYREALAQVEAGGPDEAPELARRVRAAAEPDAVRR